MTSPTVRSPRSSTERSIAFSAGASSSVLSDAVQLDGAAQHLGLLLRIASAIGAHAEQAESTRADPARRRGPSARGASVTTIEAAPAPARPGRRAASPRSWAAPRRRPRPARSTIDRGVGDAGGAEERRSAPRWSSEADRMLTTLLPSSTRAHRLVLAVEQAVHQRGAAVALLRQTVHARARGAGDRRLGRRHVGAAAPGRARTSGAATRGGRWNSSAFHRSFRRRWRASSRLRSAASSTSRRDEGLADAARQDEGELARLGLLVAAHVLDQLARRSSAGGCRRRSRAAAPAGRPRRDGGARAPRRPAGRGRAAPRGRRPAPCRRRPPRRAAGRRRSRSRPRAHGRRCGRD